MTAALRWGVLGARSNIWNRVLRPAMEASTVCEVVSLGSREGGVSYADVVADANVEAVYIPLPNGMHREWAERCAAAGKHVLCEKPLAPTSADAAAMAGTFAAAGLVLAEAYFAPFHPRTEQLLALVRAGGLGSLRSARAHFTFDKPDRTDYRWNPDQGGGSLLDVGIYCIEPMLAAAGRRVEDVRGVAATAHREGGVDAVFHAWLDLGAGLAASFTTGMAAPLQQSLELVGSAGTVRIADRAYVAGEHDDHFTVERVDGTAERVVTGGANPYRLMIEQFVRTVRGEAEWPRGNDRAVALLHLEERLLAAAQR